MICFLVLMLVALLFPLVIVWAAAAIFYQVVRAFWRSL